MTFYKNTTKKNTTMVRLPATGKVIFLPKNSGDHCIDYSNYPDISESIREEDTIVIGNWEDYSGSGTVGPSTAMLQGIINPQQFDLNAAIAGVKDMPRTARGNLKATTRQRSRLVTVESNK